MSKLALPQGAKERADSSEWAPEDHDHVKPYRICPHTSGQWGTGIQIPGVSVTGQAVIDVKPYTGMNYSRCNRLCAKFIPDTDDDPTNKKQGGARGQCADVLAAKEAAKLTKLFTALSLQLASDAQSRAESQFPDIEEGLAAVAAQDNEAKDTTS